MKNKKNNKNNKKVVKIKNTKEYLSLFPDDNKSVSERKRMLALKEALETRKFEISLYWKRTGFFWAFITVIYTALFNVFCKYLECPCKYFIFVPAISVLAGLGFFFSLAWHMVNKGSKFWQENWEKHVALLERSEIGPLHDVYLNPKGGKLKRWNPAESFDFSVTKVNMWASSAIVIVSLCCWIGILVWLILCGKENLCIIIVPAVVIFILIILLLCFSDGNKNLQFIGTDSEEPDLNMIHIL
ncbi:hypothetical protein [uncultured Treponema sp.]|uniref:RipA family octameric membrane protein n=1 Tax=uncultured Treponema sp. TaxID=162155 RepID=UPI0025D3051F|nr:hypothetical protein [uncultured Treponema sp.]